MKIKSVTCNNRKKCFEVITRNGKEWAFPYSQLQYPLKKGQKVVRAKPDPEQAYSGFIYWPEGQDEDEFVPMDVVLSYNKDPEYMRKKHLFNLTCDALDIIEKKKLPKNEIIRRMGTSPTQFYRLIDTTFYRKTIDQMLKLLAALDYEVEIKLKKVA